jgi:hypothetical protein
VLYQRQLDALDAQLCQFLHLVVRIALNLSGAGPCFLHYKQDFRSLASSKISCASLFRNEYFETSITCIHN